MKGIRGMEGVTLPLVGNILVTVKSWSVASMTRSKER